MKRERDPAQEERLQAEEEEARGDVAERHAGEEEFAEPREPAVEDPMQIEMVEDEEADDEHWIGPLLVCSQTGPPWRDENGLALSAENVKEAMDKELKSFADFGVYEEVLASEYEHVKDAIRVDARWHLVMRQA